MTDPESLGGIAAPIETALDWQDLALDAETRRQVEEIGTWVEHGRMLDPLRKYTHPARRGLTVLFHGPHNSAMALAVCLIGKASRRPVYRVDVSALLAKYSSDTEKNLDTLFGRAERGNWILFFDEADSLFGKRTESRDANDRAGNQQAAYLLQRIEDHPGVVILATNLRSHVDDAFARRFQAMIRFVMPQPSRP